MPKSWLVTGCAGFIGSHLLETLLKHDQEVVGIDNFATGYDRNLREVQALVTEDQWDRFRLIRGDIQDHGICKEGVSGRDYILHQAALGSVPGSIKDPIGANGTNVTGFINMLAACREAKVKRFVYASSCAVYGDQSDSPNRETDPCRPLSPYAVTKQINELYAGQFAQHYGLECLGLRYFNVFGVRQDKEGAYAAVIPKWIAAMIEGEEIVIYGDGETTRDFCYVDNVVQANLLAATVSLNGIGGDRVFNIALGAQTTLRQLFEHLKEEASGSLNHLHIGMPVYGDSRAGDVRISMGNIERAAKYLGYAPTHSVREGLAQAMNWYISNSS